MSRGGPSAVLVAELVSSGRSAAAQPAFEPGRPVRRKIFERHARPLKLLHERRIFHQRRRDDDAGGRR